MLRSKRPFRGEICEVWFKWSHSRPDRTLNDPLYCRLGTYTPQEYTLTTYLVCTIPHGKTQKRCDTGTFSINLGTFDFHEQQRRKAFKLLQHNLHVHYQRCLSCIRLRTSGSHDHLIPLKTFIRRELSKTTIHIYLSTIPIPTCAPNRDI